MNGTILIFAFVFALMLAVVPGSAAVKPHALFSDNAVLQQGMKVPVWGTADDGEKVTVKFQNQVVSTIAKRGQWILWLEPLQAGGPFTLTINSLELKNILVGEVWVCSGQSNMWWLLAQTVDAEKAIADSKDSSLRLLTVPMAATRPKEFAVSWKKCGPETAHDFSAVGYYFGRDLRKSLKVPVGLINSSVGGTLAEAWMSRRALKANPDFKVILDNPYPVPNRSSCLYNGMIAPLLPYAIRGAIWYQGESNAGRAFQYRILFPTMIQDWRESWRQGDFPFLFVQLAPYGKIETEPGDSAWAELREAQLLTSLNVPHTAMAVITDFGDPVDIHPQNKEPVSARLALAARAVAYGERIVYSGPIYKSMKIEGDRVILSFDHVGSGLAAKDGELKGFTIADQNGKFSNAQAEIQGNKVAVWSPQVEHPTAVRYGWANCPVVNLYNEEGLPASPFRTDDFPILTKPK